ncbi:MAG: cbb3-type cytochrome c oxidase subunit I [Chloroflexi bacterium]|nr:MAG: cbb3-type cytochrome c oxidase subunit I [Chloroflexota bacterium]
MKKIGWMEKWTLRFAVVGLIFLAMSGFEGILMRTQLAAPDALNGMETALNAIRPLDHEPTKAELFYGMMTAHPIVGIYGFVYMLVMGAFYFLVPYLLKKEIRHKKLVPVNFWLHVSGVMICWLSGFFGIFNAMYTLYWPLPVYFDRVPLIPTITFIIGAAIVMVNILLFSYNMFSTVLSKSNPRSYSFGQFLRAAFGISRLMKWLGKEDENAPDLDYNGLPVFIVAVGRGSIDTVINAIVLLVAGVLILVYGVAALFGSPLDPSAVDALVYKNWFWWGLDMVADGNALMYTAGVWYLLIPLLTGRELVGRSVVKTVIMVDLLVSMGVWSHHLLGDQVQPLFMRILSGQLITWGEFFTMGLTIFASLMTIWKARPVKMTPALRFILGSIFGFAMGGVAGLIQANVGLNMVFHNTQWVVALHAHTFLLTGVGMMLFGVVYALLPMLTELELRSKRLVDVHFWGWIVGSVVMAYVMGMAGSQGMLRRMLYPHPNPYTPYTVIAMGSGILMAVGFLAFLVNVVTTLGWTNVLSLVVPERWLERKAETVAA